MNIKGISIIGLGALGQPLTQAFLANDLPVKSIFNRTESLASKFAAGTRIKTTASFPEHADQLGDLIFLTVPDGLIPELAESLAKCPGDFTDKSFVHCSGNEPASLLSRLRDRGGHIASMHPLQTFSAASSADDFQDIYCSLQGDREVLATLEGLAATIGAQTIRVTGRQKSHLHAAAVMASNYMVTLLDSSAEIGALSGLDRQKVQQLLAPLIQTTVHNVGQASFGEAISGPIARGDIETVQQHLDLLKSAPKIRKLYSRLGLETLDKMEAATEISSTSAQKLRQLLKE